MLDCNIGGRRRIVANFRCLNFLTTVLLRPDEELIRFSDLEAHVKATRSPGSVRNYLAVLRYLRRFFNQDAIKLDQLTPEIVGGFAEYLAEEGISATSSANYMSIFRALFKDSFGTGRAAEFKRVFAAISSKPVKTSSRPVVDDLQKIARNSFSTYPFLQKVRGLLLLSYLNGGLSLSQLKKLVATDNYENNQYLAYLNREFGGELSQFAASLSSESYSKATDAIARLSGIKSTLNPDQLSELWKEMARKEGISGSVIEKAMDWKQDTSQPLEQAVEDAFSRVGTRVLDIKQRWYALRCKNQSPADFEQILRGHYLSSSGSPIDTFLPPPAKPIEELLFFKTDTQTATRIRKEQYGRVWVYSQAGSGKPLPISDTEMRMFMFLCNQSHQTISYHFGDTAVDASTFTPGLKAEIIHGNFQGHIGVIERAPGNSYKVVMRIPALSGIVTANIPAEFLRIV